MSVDREAAIKRTGELMLSSWKLLSIMCPICHSALLSKGENMRCPGCDLPVVGPNSSELSCPSPPVTIGTASAAQRIAGTGAISADGTFDRQKLYESVTGSNIYADAEEDSSDEHAVTDTIIEEDGLTLEKMRQDFNARSTSAKSVSDKLGEKMLAGWCMLGAICPKPSCNGTPLMQLRGGPQVCVSCDTEFISNEFGALIPTSRNSFSAFKGGIATHHSKDSDKAPSPAPAPTCSSQSSASARSCAAAGGRGQRDPSFYLDMNNAPTLEPFPLEPPSSSASGATGRADLQQDASAKLAQKMLQGWALLERTCPSIKCNGSVPLVRRPTDRQVHDVTDLPLICGERLSCYHILDESFVNQRRYFFHPCLLEPHIFYRLQVYSTIVTIWFIFHYFGIICLQVHCVQCDYKEDDSGKVLPVTVGITPAEQHAGGSSRGGRTLEVSGDDDDDEDEDLEEAEDAAVYYSFRQKCLQQAHEEARQTVDVEKQKSAIAAGTCTYSDAASSAAAAGDVLGADEITFILQQVSLTNTRVCVGVLFFPPGFRLASDHFSGR